MDLNEARRFIDELQKVEDGVGLCLYYVDSEMKVTKLQFVKKQSELRYDGEYATINGYRIERLSKGKDNALLYIAKWCKRFLIANDFLRMEGINGDWVLNI